MMYSLLKPLIFALDPETAHETSLEMLNTLRFMLPKSRVTKPVNVMGLEFPNAIGLAAGLDKNAEFLPGLSRLGFGFIEVGTVTPKPQPGNPRPRLFRVTQHQSIINRMGFNNHGIDVLLKHVEDYGKRDFILGINIGKNLSTAVDNALSDYQIGMQKVYLAADYITVNISSPNTPGLRSLQTRQALDTLLNGLNETRKQLQDQHRIRKPIALKVAPDLHLEEIQVIADLLQQYQIDALIATNTTLDRSVIKGHPLQHEAGGLSGAALTDLSRNILFQFDRYLQGKIPIISAGGIDSAREAQLRLDLGASLVQIYSALIYQGPGLVSQIAHNLTPNTSSDQ